MTTDFKGKAYNVFQMFNDRWAVATAGTLDKFNAMTISWGSLGTLWGFPSKGKSTVTIFVNPARYTYEFVEANEYFTVSFFPDKYRKDLSVLGSKSGRDCDKVAMTGLTPIAAKQGVTFEQAELTFVCKKIYSHQFDLEKVPKDVSSVFYAKAVPHVMYIGEIVDVIEH